MPGLSLLAHPNWPLCLGDFDYRCMAYIVVIFGFQGVFAKPLGESCFRQGSRFGWSKAAFGLFLLHRHPKAAFGVFAHGGKLLFLQMFLDGRRARVAHARSLDIRVSSHPATIWVSSHPAIKDSS